MNIGRVLAIKLHYMPNPHGDNRLDIDIREGNTSVTYLATSRAECGARYVTLRFENCYALRYFVTEDHESLCPGIERSESEFVEIHDSPWIRSQPIYVEHMKHYAFGLNHSFFECIADAYEVRTSTR